MNHNHGVNYRKINIWKNKQHKPEKLLNQIISQENIWSKVHQNFSNMCYASWEMW